MSIEFINMLYSEKTQLPNESSYFEKVLENKDFIKVAPQIYTLLKEQGKLEKLPVFFLENLKERFTQTLYLNMFIKSELQKIYLEFEKQGIDIIPLKGVWFSEKYFGHLGARPTSDIDLLVKPRDLEKAVETIRSLGFTVEQDDIEGHFHTSLSKVQSWSKVPLTVEIHWNLLQEGTADFDISEFWKQSQPLEPFQYVREFSDYHTFYMICIHGWRHNLDSLKYYLDIM
jgi:hypothetical protein